MRRAIVAVVGTSVAWVILLIFFGLAAALVWLLLSVGWAVVILATGGGFKECEAANIDCGTLAEFTVRTSPLVPIGFAVASALIVGSAFFVYRRFTRDS
jgi:hypothetical protein